MSDIRFDGRVALITGAGGGLIGAGPAVTALQFLIGGETAIVADAAGGVSAWFPVPDAASPTGRRLARIHVFEPHEAPVLHVARFPADGLEQVIDQINATGFGLTLGLLSRIDAVRRLVEARAHVGNLYVNRNQIGAVVGSQPFGGEGLSGTGPKAGGPHYVLRFATERVTTVDTTAAGGNASLMAGG